eukprot:9579582-Alexandrium_andersonii.AAC.1
MPTPRAGDKGTGNLLATSVRVYMQMRRVLEGGACCAIPNARAAKKRTGMPWVPSLHEACTPVRRATSAHDPARCTPRQVAERSSNVEPGRRRSRRGGETGNERAAWPMAVEGGVLGVRIHRQECPDPRRTQ